MRENSTHLFMLLLAASFLSFGALPAEACNQTEGDARSIWSSDMAKTRKAAINGDSVAARELWRTHFFGNCGESLAEGLFWMRLAAEQGDCESIREYKSWLYSRKEVEESREWRRRYSRLKCKSTGMRDLLKSQGATIE